MIFLKLEGEEKIPMPVGYEHLPDFCFCCGHIGHSLKECAQYKGQSQREATIWGLDESDQNK